MALAVCIGRALETLTRMLVRRRMRTFATVTTMVANTMRSASTSSKFVEPPSGSTSTRARKPPTIAPRDAPEPISPNNRFA